MAPDQSAKYLVRSHGELWSAYSTDILEIGEQVNIVAIKGIGVVVKQAENSPHPGKTGNGKTMLSGVKDNEWHCH